MLIVKIFPVAKEYFDTECYNTQMNEITVGQKYIIPGIGKGMMPEFARVEVTEVSPTLLPVLNKLDHAVRVRFADGSEQTISGISLRMGGRLIP